MTSPFNRVVDALHAHGSIVKMRGDRHADAQCPAHDDRNPSLSIDVAPDDERVLLCCHTGCTTDAVCAALGLTMADLFVNQKAGKFPDGRRHETPVASLVVSHGSPNGGTGGRSMSNGARANSTDLTPAYPGSDGAATPPRREACAYPYADADGEVLFEVVRYEPKGFAQRRVLPGGGRAWGLNGIDEPPLYRLPAVISAVKAGTTVWVVEGEKDADALVAKGFVATCNPMGAGKWRAWHTRALEGAAEVRIVADDDDTGRAHASTVARALTAAGVPVSVWLPAEGCKDMTDHLRAKKTRDDLRPFDWEAEPEGAEGPDDETDGPGELRTTWEDIDLAEYLSGTYQPLEPTVLACGDHHLLYAGQVNVLYGASGSGKSWVALAAVAEAIQAGQDAGYIDLEDHPRNIVTRLQALGCTLDQIAQRLHYKRPEMRADMYVIEQVDQLIGDTELAVLVIDSVGEAMALQGLKQNDDDEVAGWWRTYARHWAGQGPAVILIDHVPKNPGAEGFSIGSQRKKAATDGHMLEVKQTVAFARGVEGKISLTCRKDRNGTFAHGAVVAEVAVTSDADANRVTLAFQTPEGRSTAGSVERPTIYMERVSEWLYGRGVVSRHQIETGVEGKANLIRKAIDTLISEGYVTTESANFGPKNKPGVGLRLVRQFSSLLAPDMSSLCRPMSSRDDISEAEDMSFSRPTPLRGGTGRHIGGRGRSSDADMSSQPWEDEEDDSAPW